MVQDYTNMSVQDKLRLADERLEKLKGTDKYDAFKKRVDAMHAKYGSVPETYTWADQKLNNKIEAYEFDAKAHGRVDKNGEADIQKDPLPMLDEWVVLDHGSDKYGISERGIMTRPIPKFFTQPTKPPSPDALADSYRKATKPLDYLRLKRGGTVDELAASFKVMKRGLGTTQAAKGGEAPDLTGMSNFLATDKVPDTIFGIPVVSRREDYTEADITFFKEHPEAGGYYDMGEGTPEDGTVEGAPVQADAPVRLGVDVDRAVRETQDHVNTADSFIAASKLIKRWEKFESKARQRLRADGTKEDVFTIGEGFTNLIDADGRETPVTGETPDMSGDENQVQLYRHLLKYDDTFRSRFGTKYTSMSPSTRGAMLSVAFNAGPHVYLKGTKKDKKTLLSPRFEARLAMSQNLETALDGNLDYGAEPRRSETARIFKLGVDGPWQDQSLRVRISRAAVEAMSPKGGAMDRDVIIRALADRVIKRGAK